jgi:hypothetical protein
VTDADGGTDVVFTNITSTLGSCSYVSNSTSGNNFYVKYNCSSSTPGSSTIVVGFKDSGDEYVETSGANNSYPDHSPTLGAPSITPASPNTSSTLTCNAGYWSDPDADTENTGARTWKWYKDGSIIGGQTSQTLGSSHFSKDNSVLCEQTATANTWNKLQLPTLGQLQLIQLIHHLLLFKTLYLLYHQLQ